MTKRIVQMMMASIALSLGFGGAQHAEAASPRPLPQWKELEGVQTLFAEKHDTPLVTLFLAFPGGAYFDPTGKTGRADVFTSLLLRGTKNRTRDQIETTLDEMGATLSGETGYHSFLMRGQVLNRHLPQFIELLAEILSTPTFPEAEFVKLRKETISQLKLRLENDGRVAKDAFYQAVYEPHPYARDLMGTENTLEAITRADVVAFYEQFVQRKGMAIAAAGDLKASTFEDLVRKLTAALPDTGIETKVQPVGGNHLKGRRILLLDKPDRSQTQFYLGQLGIKVSDPDATPLTIFLQAFGGGMFQAKYMQEIRVKRGWSYGARADMDVRRDGGSLYLHTFTATADTIPALNLSLELLAQATKGTLISDDDLEFAKTFLIRSFAFKLDTSEEIVAQKLYHRFVGLPADYLETYTRRIEAVTPAQAREAGRKYLDADNIEIVVLCSAKDLEKEIGKALNAKSVTVVPFTDTYK